MFGWVVTLSNQNNNNKFDENTVFMINGVEVTPDEINLNGFRARGTFYVAACDLADEYILTVEADFCSSPVGQFCTYAPTCLMKKNTLVKEITGSPDTLSKTHTSTWYKFDGSNFCGDLDIVDVREDTITGLSAYNGTYLFDKCGTEYYETFESGRSVRHWVAEMRKVGEGTRTVKDTRTTHFLDPFTQEPVSHTTVNEFVQELEYYVSGANRIPLNDGRLLYRIKGDFNTLTLFDLAYPCDTDPEDGINGVISAIDAGSLELPKYVSCMSYITEGGAGVEDGVILTVDPNINAEYCCRPTCRDESSDPPILDFQYLNNSWTADSEWDSCTGITTPEFQPVKIGSYKVYYDCL